MKNKNIFRLTSLFLILVMAVCGVYVYRFDMDAVISDGMEAENSIEAENSGEIEEKAELSAEDILALAPVNDEQSAFIDKLQVYNKDDTWSIYLYMIGSNLESNGEDYLSDITDLLVEDERLENEGRLYDDVVGRIKRFMSELDEKNVSLPQIFYSPSPEKTGEQSIYGEYSEESDTNEEPADEAAADEGSNEENSEAENIEAEEEILEGSGTLDLEEMLKVELPENVRIIIQTGGALSWANADINPNRSQRFIYDKDGFRRLEDNPIRNMCDPATLEDFLKFCRENYTSDHNVCIMWDHGSGAFGYGHDEIYSSSMTLKDLNKAFSAVYEKNIDNPPFEIIGFDACLMANLDVAGVFEGLSEYCVASEELEPGNGWNYEAWLSELVKNPEINAARLGKYIADSYIETSIKDGEFEDEVVNCTMSVIDLSKTAKLREAYSVFSKKVLEKAIEDSKNLAAFSWKTSNAIAYGEYDAATMNTYDLGSFMDQIGTEYPEEYEAVKKALKDSVLYTRASSYTIGSSGISVYFPLYIRDYYGLNYFLEYVYGICEDEAVRALYYYKIAGCLNNDFQKDALALGLKEAKIIDTSVMDSVSDLDIEIKQNNISLNVPVEVRNLLENISVRMDGYNKETDEYIVYGDASKLKISANDSIEEKLKDSWIGINGQILCVDVTGYVDDGIRYSSKISYNDMECYLDFAYNTKLNKYEITGIRRSSGIATGADRTLYPVEEGTTFTPIYKTGTIGSMKTKEILGEEIVWKEGMKIEDIKLPDGCYFESVCFTDLRGDEYYSSPIQTEVKDEKIVNTEVRYDLKSTED